MKKIILCTIISCFVLTGCLSSQPKNNTPDPDQVIINDNTKLSNPASIYCKNQGGQPKTMLKPDISQHGICFFEDGSQCEEWRFLRNECDPGQVYSLEFKDLSRQKAQKITEDWILTESPTYAFDGFDLEHLATTLVGRLGTYMSVFSFKSRQSGYGSRLDETTTQVITNHKIKLITTSGNIDFAVTDDTYDEIAGEITTGPLDLDQFL